MEEAVLLGDYLAARNMTLKAFADSVGSDESSISRYVRGERVPRGQTMARIIAITNGQVTANDFLPAVNKEAPAASDPAAA